ncbi:hypothetical protein ACLOJK_037594 [Asimina triloba]
MVRPKYGAYIHYPRTNLSQSLPLATNVHSSLLVQPSIVIDFVAIGVELKPLSTDLSVMMLQRIGLVKETFSIPLGLMWSLTQFWSSTTDSLEGLETAEDLDEPLGIFIDQAAFTECISVEMTGLTDIILLPSNLRSCWSELEDASQPRMPKEHL